MIKSLLNDPHQRKLLQKWGPILESGKPIQSEETKIALAQILENTRNFFKMRGMLNEAGVAQTDVVGTRTSTNAGVMSGDPSVPYSGGKYGDFYLPNIVLPMLRRIMPNLMANELVGVQPLNGPVGYALAYRPVYNGNGILGEPSIKNGNPNADKNTTKNEIGYNPTETNYTGKKGDVDAALTTSNYWKSYVGTTNADRWNGVGTGLGQETEFAKLSDGSYPTVSFQLVKSPVEATTRKLAAHWSPELAEDMQAMQGIDVEREMVNTLTYEVGAEIDRQIITEMVKAAIIGGSTSDWNPSNADGLDQMSRLATLLTQITIEANQIAIRTKRGSANFAVTTPRICALLQQLSMNKFTSFKTSAALPTVPDTGVGALTKVGLINDDSILLVRDAYTQAADSDYILLGYKGKQAGDSGIIYCPYVPLQLSKVLQPDSFTPSIGCRTRYGVMSNPWDAKNFYAFIKVEGVSETYALNGERHFIFKPSSLDVPTANGGPIVQG